MPEQIDVTGIFHDVTGKPFNSDRKACRTLNRMIDKRDHIIVELPIHRLRATQRYVNDDYVEASLRHRPGTPDFSPAVIKYNQIYYVTDGHHRIVALHSFGAILVAVRLFDLDGDTQTDMPILEFLGI